MHRYKPSKPSSKQTELNMGSHPSAGGVVAGFTAVLAFLGAHLATDWPLLQNLAYCATILAATVSVICTMRKKKQP